MTKLPYDGIVEFLVPDVECLRRAREDSFYTDKVAGDENSFFDTDPKALAWTVGWEEIYIAGGSVLGDGAKGIVTGR